MRCQHLELHADDLAALAEDRALGREARVNLDTEFLGLLGEPPAELAEGDDVVALLLQLRGRLQGPMRGGVVYSSFGNQYKESLTTGVSKGQPISFQSGKSSFSARASKTLPDRMWAPISAPFSTTHTLISFPCSAATGSPPRDPPGRRRR